MDISEKKTMRLRLNLSEVEVQLKIGDWQSSKEDADLDLEWCDVELSLAGEYIKYGPCGELLMNYEVSGLCETLEELTTGMLKEDEHVWFAEPDMEFYFRTAKRLYSDPEKVFYRDGYRDVDIDGKWKINFWTYDGLGGNAFIMKLRRSELEALCNYLRYVVGKLQSDDPVILEMLEKGQLLPE